MLNGQSMSLQHLRTLLLPSLQLQITMTVDGRHNIFTLNIKLLHAAVKARRIRYSLLLLLLLARFAARRDELPARGNKLRHAIQRDGTKRLALAFSPFCGCSGGPAVVWLVTRSKQAFDAILCGRLHLTALSACACTSATAASKADLKTSMCWGRGAWEVRKVSAVDV